jgi:hypothetical protein
LNITVRTPPSKNGKCLSTIPNRLVLIRHPLKMGLW